MNISYEHSDQFTCLTMWSNNETNLTGKTNKNVTKHAKIYVGYYNLLHFISPECVCALYTMNTLLLFILVQ